MNPVTAAYEETTAAVAGDARFRALIENAVDLTSITDEHGRLIYVSPSAERVTGFAASEIVGATGWDFAHPDDEPLLQEVFATIRDREAVRVGPFRARHKDGSWRRLHAVALNLLDDPAVSGIVWTIRDATNEHELAERLRLAERLEAVGQLAGGISHDFNNLLLVIRGYASVMRSAIDDPQLCADLDEITAAADRAADLTRQLLAFSGRQPLQPMLIDLRAVVSGMRKLLQRSIREDIELAVDVDRDVRSVVADPGQIEQVLLNFVVNSRDALPNGGRIEITVAPAVLDARSAVALSVSDTGTGIADADLPHIFEPFYTTKAEGIGTGLGLSTVYGIVSQSGGAIEVAPLPAGGTRMTVLLPAAAGRPAEDEEETPVPPPPAVPAETVLLVEDEEAVRELVRRVLESAGYEVLAASRPSEAQRLAAEHDVDLLLTDVVMPEMSGYDLASRVRLTRPEAKTLFMSGYAHRALGDATERPQGELLRKPFSPDALAAAVRAVLDDDFGAQAEIE